MPERRGPAPNPPAVNRILVVEDEESLRMLLSSLLEEEGYEVVTATDGETALQMLVDSNFDLAICDVRMPKIDGWGFLDALRERGQQPPVIMMSAYGDRDIALNVM